MAQKKFKALNIGSPAQQQAAIEKILQTSGMAGNAQDIGKILGQFQKTLLNALVHNGVQSFDDLTKDQQIKFQSAVNLATDVQTGAKKATKHFFYKSRDAVIVAQANKNLNERTVDESIQLVMNIASEMQETAAELDTQNTQEIEIDEDALFAAMVEESPELSNNTSPDDVLDDIEARFPIAASKGQNVVPFNANDAVYPALPKFLQAKDSETTKPTGTALVVLTANPADRPTLSTKDGLKTSSFFTSVKKVAAGVAAIAVMGIVGMLSLSNPIPAFNDAANFAKDQVANVTAYASQMVQADNATVPASEVQTVTANVDGETLAFGFVDNATPAKPVVSSENATVTADVAGTQTPAVEETVTEPATAEVAATEVVEPTQATAENTTGYPEPHVVKTVPVTADGALANPTVDAVETAATVEPVEVTTIAVIPTAVTFDNADALVRSFYEAQGVTMPRAMERTLDKMDEVNAQYKGHQDMGAYHAARTLVDTFGATAITAGPVNQLLDLVNTGSAEKLKASAIPFWTAKYKLG